MPQTKSGQSVPEQAEAHSFAPWGGVYLGGPPRGDPRGIVGEMMINFGTVEFMTIMLLRLLLAAGQDRSKLLKAQLRRRIAAIIPLLEASDLLESRDRAAAVDALKCLRSVAKVRNMVAHDPFLQVGGKWIWAQVRDTDDLDRVPGVTIEKIAVAVDYTAKYGLILEGLLRPHINNALGMPEQSQPKKWTPQQSPPNVPGAEPSVDSAPAPEPPGSRRKR